MRPPRNLTIASQRFVVTVEPIKKKLGRMTPAKQAIKLNPKQAPDSMADTLLHEVQHAIWAQTPLVTTDFWSQEVEEAIIRATTPFILDVLRRNPRLIEYLRDPS